ncbi:sugar transporter [Tenacibaculum holothuriorum]|uniref:Sugar transporter n=1 Tax=Tenacibaculum holothuriorum TaxID=1635173 RepID=A0A1Y2PEI0_9FLAO|nr:polysaccharide biosynthesis/export family protein [Tenacibaculum holothuriorum]OSY88129.1 sugar transporter [Tenacibaculum holothuriorum]
MLKVKSLIVLLIVLSCTFISCVSKKEVVYFQDENKKHSLIENSFKTTIKPNDLLQITVSALDIEAAKPFNLPAATFATTTNSVVGTPQQQSYLVDSEGFIEFPLLGKLKVGGFTRQEIIKLLNNKLSPDYIKNPTINIRISNFSITVLGDVKTPGRFIIPNERITILEAIGLAGDLNISGVRTVQVKREENNQIITYKLDLKSNSIFTSPAYYLQQNDVVYVEPNKARSQSASFNQNSGLFISAAGLLISIITLIVR